MKTKPLKQFEMPRLAYDSPRHLLIPEEANILVDGYNRIHRMEIVRGQTDQVIFSDHKITIQLRDTAMDEAADSSTAFHAFRAYIVPQADCNDPADYPFCIQVRAGLVEFRSEYWPVTSNAAQGIIAGGPLTQYVTQPIWPVTAGSDGIVGLTNGSDYTDPATGSSVARTTVAVGNAGDYGDASFAQFVFTDATDGDGYNFASIWVEITEGDEDTAPTFAIKARHWAYNAGGTGRTTNQWPTGLVIPLAIIEFVSGTIENVNSGHIINRNSNRSQGLIYRGAWDATRWFYEGDMVFHEATVGDYVIRHWRCVFGHRNEEPVDLTLTRWYPLDPKYIPP